MHWTLLEAYEKCHAAHIVEISIELHLMTGLRAELESQSLFFQESVGCCQVFQAGALEDAQ